MDRAPRAPPPPPERSPPTLDELETVFAALAHEARRHIVILLSNAGGELHSGYLAARFHHSWPTTTRHLGVLEKAGIVDVRREGRSSHYRLNRERLRHVVEGWLRHLDPIGPEKTWAPTGPRSMSELTAPHEAAPCERDETRAPSPPKKNKKGRPR